MSNNTSGRWTKQPPPGSGPICTFIFIPASLGDYLRENKDLIQSNKVTRVPPRAAQRLIGPDGKPLWLVAGSENLWTEARLAMSKAVWWSKTTDVPMISIDPGVPTDDRDEAQEEKPA